MVIAMHQIGEFIEEHFPVKDVQMPNTPSRMFRHVHVGLKKSRKYMLYELVDSTTLYDESFISW